MSTMLDIVPGPAWFEGHFPGRPILPGVAQLALVLDALARHRGRPVALDGLEFVRLRQTVAPGERLQLTADERPGGHLRITLARDGAMVTNGELRFDRRPAAAPPPVVVRGTAPTGVPLPDAFLPHRPPMRFVTGVLGESADALTCSARIPAGCALVADGSAPAVAAIEAAAQAAAVWEATRRRRDGGDSAPRLGYLVGMRAVTFFRSRIPAEETFFATVRLEASASALTHYSMQVDLASGVLLSGTLATFLTDETMPA